MNTSNQMTSMILQHIVKIIGGLGGILIVGGITLAFFPGLVGNHAVSIGDWKVETDQIGFAMAAVGAAFVTVMLGKTLNALVRLKSVYETVSERLTVGKRIKVNTEV
jgi:hypothetical protein